MPHYRCRALSQDGTLVAMDLDAADPAAAVAALQERHLLAIALEPADRLRAWRRLWAGAARVDRGAYVLLVQELAGLLDDALPLSQALDVLATQAPDRRSAAMLRDVGARVRAGAPLHIALAAARAPLPPIALAMAEAGESSGALADMLRQAGGYMERTDRLRRGIETALVYPAIITATGAMSLGFVVFGVLPRFATMFAQAGVALPVPTRIVVGLGDVATQWGWLAVPAALAAGAFLHRELRDPHGRRRLHRVLLRVPYLSGLIRLADAARFCRAVGTLEKAGIPLYRCAEMATPTLANAAIAGTVAALPVRLREGESLASWLAGSAVFPPLVDRMAGLGEETGRLGEMLERAAEILDRDFQRKVERLQAALVPGLTIMLGGVVAGIVASIMLALLRMNDLAS